jgi:hypothetical protein
MKKAKSFKQHFDANTLQPILTYNHKVHPEKKKCISGEIYFHIFAKFANFLSDVTSIQPLLAISFRYTTW